MQLRALDHSIAAVKMHSDTLKIVTYHVTDFDVQTNAEPSSACDIIHIHCQRTDENFLFDNVCPRFHMRPAHMETYASAYTRTSLELNLERCIQFTNAKRANSVYKVEYFERKSLLFFKFKKEVDAPTYHIISPFWDSGAFAIAHTFVAMPRYRLCSIGSTTSG